MANCNARSPTASKHTHTAPANFNDPACNWPNCASPGTKEENIPGTWCDGHMELIKDDIFPWAFP